MYNDPITPLGDDLKEHFRNPRTMFFPRRLFEETRYPYYPETVQAYPWISLFLVGDMLGEKGREFTQWALEELAAWDKASYRKKDNSFVPILTDGISIEGYVCKENNSYAPKGAVAKPLFADLTFFWAYAVAHRTTNDKFMWDIVRNIAIGNDLGDIGETSINMPKLRTDTTCCDVCGLLGFLELYAKTNKSEFLQVAQRIGDNIVGNQFHKGFFVPSKRHIYTRFDCFEPLALLHLHAATTSKTGPVPQVWPSCALFVPPYRHRDKVVDRWVIYALTESPELPLSLQEAAAIGDVELVRSLLNKGVDVDSWDDLIRNTALHRAARSGHKDVVELLLAKGAHVDSVNAWPRVTPLHYAAEKGHKDITELLIAKGADVNAKDIKGRTPVDVALRRDHSEVVKLLIEKGADVSLHVVARIGALAKVKSLIEEEADVNAENLKGETPIDIAMMSNRKDVVELLIEKGAELSIHVAAYLGDIDKVKSFIEKGTSVNVESGPRKRTPLYWAVKNKYKDVAKLLIDKGADVSSINLLYYACWYGYRDFVELFIQKGADVNSKDWGESPSHYAVWGNHADVLELLLAHGADANAKDTDAWSLLHYAAGSGSTDMTGQLLDKGADVNAKENEGGQTPLHRAATKGHANIVEILLAKGADINAKDNNDKTALSYATENGHTEIVELLRKHGAKE